MSITHTMSEELDEIATSHVNRGYSDSSFAEVRYDLDIDFDIWYSRKMMDEFLEANPKWK